jgi:hypothetical protein
VADTAVDAVEASAAKYAAGRRICAVIDYATKYCLGIAEQRAVLVPLTDPLPAL